MTVPWSVGPTRGIACQKSKHKKLNTCTWLAPPVLVAGGSGSHAVAWAESQSGLIATAALSEVLGDVTGLGGKARETGVLPPLDSILVIVNCNNLASQVVVILSHPLWSASQHQRVQTGTTGATRDLCTELDGTRHHSGRFLFTIDVMFWGSECFGFCWVHEFGASQIFPEFRATP